MVQFQYWLSARQSFGREESRSKIGASPDNRPPGGHMRRTDFDHTWQELSQEVITGMKEWRLQHPKATFALWGWAFSPWMTNCSCCRAA